MPHYIDYTLKMSQTKIFILILILMVVNTSPNLYAQKVIKQTSDNTTINEPYLYPWAGGIDAVQFCEVDLNLDGINDLLVFDKRGNRKMCLVNKGIPNVVDYEFSNDYDKLLPDLFDWVIFRDYNNDGRMDIFTYSPGYGGIIVYKNVSASILKFERVVFPYLKTKLPGGYVNLYVTYADYPGIADVDNDGDLDIITFGVFQSFVDMHKNMSMEKYGTADSLDFEHFTYCWGRFAESDESNVLYFDTCFGGASYQGSDYQRKDRHTGSTFLVHDIDDNGLTDVLLGDVDFPGLFALYNNGTTEEAVISDYDTIFPDLENKVDLFSMPCAAFIDVNNDNVNELLVSVFDPGITTSENKTSSWYYENTGTNTLPELTLVDKSFLQDNMIDLGSGAYPVLFDWDEDGLQDLFVGNYGYYYYSYYDNHILKSVYYSTIAYFKNVGTTNNPVFQMWEYDFAGLGRLMKIGLIPAFDDINGDGLTDILIGNSKGDLIYLEGKQDGTLEIMDESFMNIDVGMYSAPQLFDLDGDSKKDLIIGEKAGNINYYRNISNGEESVFELVTDYLGKLYVTDSSTSNDGYSTPSFFRDQNQETGLVVGSEKGIIYYYTNIDNNLEGSFTESDQLNQLLDTSNINFDRGLRTGAIIVNLHNNNKLEMIVGNYSGGLEYFNGVIDVNSGVPHNYTYNSLDIYPNPANNIVNIKLPFEPEIVEVSIHDLYGKEYLSSSYSFPGNIISIELDAMINGVFVLSARSGDSLYVSKLIIMK
jgi:type IX secretion system substrate protein/VCBS repeat protein